MRILTIAALSLGVLASPTMAQSLSDTHEMRWSPAGKNPVVTYHPLKACEQQPASGLHLSGKMQYAVPAEPSGRCAKRIASTEHREQRQAEARD
jgi:hypothetical protein